MKKALLNRPFPHFKFPFEIEIEVKPMEESDCKWFNTKLGSYELRTINYGWFPTNILMGVIDGKYSDTNNLGATLSGNMGTATIAVVDKEKAIELLLKEGYNIKNNG